jgi:hypothetical protein
VKEVCRVRVQNRSRWKIYAKWGRSRGDLQGKDVEQEKDIEEKQGRRYAEWSYRTEPGEGDMQSEAVKQEQEKNILQREKQRSRRSRCAEWGCRRGAGGGDTYICSLRL